MIREVDIDEISDGKRYKANDMVKCGTNDCAGCSDCCHSVSDTIILDPYDIYMLGKGTSKTFSELLSEEKIELHMIDGILLPNIKMQADGAGCAFLNSDERCSIHNYRPGFCRLFPLGRVYEDDHFDYFLQIHECPRIGNAKIKVKKWLGIPQLAEYEKYILVWHNHVRDFTAEIKNGDPGNIAKLTVTFLKHYYEKPYDFEKSFYEQFYDRYNQLS